MTKTRWIAACAVISALVPVAAFAQSAVVPSTADEAVESLLQPALKPFTFIVPAPVPEPVPINVPDQPVPEAISLNDVQILVAPAQSKYQPEGNLDLMDEGKTFDIACQISETGNMTECEAYAASIRDQNFVDIALTNISQTVVGPIAEDGAPTAGRTLLVTAQFNRAENTPEVGELAAVD